MATQPARNPKVGLTQEEEGFLDQVGAIAAEAVRETRDANRRLGISNYSVRDGRLVEELADGTLRPVADASAIPLSGSGAPPKP